MDYKERRKRHIRRRQKQQWQERTTCGRCGGPKPLEGDWCQSCFEEMFYGEDEDFDPDEEMGDSSNTDIPRDHPMNKPKPGYRPADK